jgi:lysophospholipase L1-like esterase
MCWSLLSAAGLSCHGPEPAAPRRGAAEVPAAPEAGDLARPDVGRVTPDPVAARPDVGRLTPGEAAAPAPPPAQTVPGGALVGFVAARDRAAAADPADPAGRVGVVVFGDSHTAGDHLTGYVRRTLGARFGDGGRGFVLAGRPPIRHYYQRDVRYGSDGRWRAELGGKRDAAPPFGMAGVRAHADRRDAVAWVESCDQCGSDRVGRFDVFYLRRKDSGTLAYRVDDGPWQKLPTRLDAAATEVRAPAVLSVPASGGRHKLSLRPAGGGAIDLFGVALERGTAGVVVDAVGVVGRRLGHLRSWEWDVIGPQLAARSPALVVLQYGTNEADDPDLDLALLTRHHDAVNALIRQHVPAASILVLGAPDMAARDGNKKTCDAIIAALPPLPADADLDAGTYLTAPPECLWRTPANVPAVVEVQRAAAARNGVAFFDSLAAMGGAEQMDNFFHMTPPLAYSDHVHFTQPGYELWGQRLIDALLAGYDGRSR